MNYKIYPVYLGETKMVHHQAYYGEYGDIVHLHYSLFVLEDEDGEKILVDSGRPTTAEIEEKGYPYKISEDAPTDFLAELRKYNVDPEQVKMIIVTHLHYDHAWNLELFPNATIYAQEEEIRHAILPYRHEYQPYGLLPSCVGHTWARHIRRFQAVYGDEEIREGISVMLTPPHTVGSQSVIVDTAEGKYILVGDWIYNQDNIDREHPTGASLSTTEWFETLRKIRKVNAKVLGTHDNDVLRRSVYG